MRIVRNRWNDFSILIGKTIVQATLMERPPHDDAAWLRLDFTDGSHIFLTGSYGSYTSKSEDEYPCYITINDNQWGLEPVTMIDGK
jgi:hypothetical protein